MLTYTTTENRFEAKEVTKTVETPHWSTLVKKTDKILTRAGNKLIKNLSAVNPNDLKAFEKKVKALSVFVKVYKKLAKDLKSGVHDTSPRENIMAFVCECGMAVGFQEDTCADIFRMVKVK